MNINLVSRIVSILVIIAFASQMQAQDLTNQELLELVKKQSQEIKILQQEVSELKQGTPRKDYDAIREMIEDEVAEQTSSDDDPFGKIDIHGFISQGYIHSTGNNWIEDSRDGSFAFNELAINLSTQLTDRLRAGVQLFSRDYGDTGNNKVYVDWAYGDYRWQDWLGFRAGILRTPFGFYNETRDIDLLRSSIFLPQGVYNEFFRDALSNVSGGGVYGNIPMDMFGDISYSAQGGSIGIDEDGGLASQLQGLGIGSVNDISDKYAYMGSIVWNTPLDGLRLGVSSVNSKLSVSSNLDSDIPVAPGVAIPSGTGVSSSLGNLKAWVASAEYTLGDLVLSSEYMRIRTDMDIETDEVPLLGVVTLRRSRYTLESYYFNAAYRFTDWLESGTYYCYAKESSGDGVDNYSIYSRFDLTDNLMFKIETQYIDGTGIYHNSSINESNQEDSWYVFAAKVTYSF